MPGSADAVQRAVHALDSGGLAIWIRRALVVLSIVGLALLYFLHEFRGLATAQAMDQAQIGRELAHGHGWATKFYRPRAFGQLQANGRNAAKNIHYDTYNAPLPPLVNAVALFPFRNHLTMTPRDIIFLGDRVIAVTGILFFLASVVLLFFIARRLFDQRLALLACGLVLVCDTLWQYSLSGLPQMLMLFLFSGTIYLLIRAIEAQFEGGRVGLWLALSGVGFGFLALSHALTIWMFVGAFIYCVFFFRPRGWAAVAMLVPFAIVYFPWLIRNYIICGQAGGVAVYALLDGMRHSEAGWMRQFGFDSEGVGPGFLRNKMASNLVLQIGSMFRYLGWSVVAVSFFASLLHSFRRSATAALRWLLLAMWGGAVIGMAAYGLNEEQNFIANQLHLLFIPFMTCYGLAFLLVLWNRLEIDLRIARLGFIALLFFLCGLPALIQVTPLTPSKAGVRWPPYVPPYIAVLNRWMQPNEITASDMPWAIAWYADRPAVWLPENITIFTDLNDYRTLGGPVNGLYLTPVSGSQNTLENILKGEYKDWATVILRSIDLQKFPLKWATLLGLENECVFFSDHDRAAAP